MIDNELEVIKQQLGNDLEKLKESTVLVTGALGMLASYTIDFFLFLNRNYDYNINMILLARSSERLKERFPSDLYKAEFIVGDISNKLDYNGNIDYILHLAGNSSPFHIKNNPIDIIKANVVGSLNIVDVAKENNVKKVIFSSTREVYGEVDTGTKFITEDNFGTFNPLDARSCYPESKRMAENVFKSASIQYGVDFCVVRIAHSYGPGMILSDGRVMADFVGNAVNGEDIELLSDGEAVRSFCYVADAVLGMLFVLLYGKSEEAYNIANESEEIKIYELAKKIAKIADGIKVTRVLPKDASVYCAYARVGLSTEKLQKLGWKLHFDLDYGLDKTLSQL